jgi:hypothetical protein
MTDDSDPQDVCNNCNVAPSEQAKGHSYRLTERGIQYDVEHLNDLGMVEENGMRLLFNRMENRLEFQCLNAVPIEELEAVADELEDSEKHMASQGVDEWADGLREAREKLEGLIQEYRGDESG